MSIAALSLLLIGSGCASTRRSLGFGPRSPDTAAEASSGTAKKSKREAKAAKVNLPAGLAGDKEHHAYTSDGPK